MRLISTIVTIALMVGLFYAGTTMGVAQQWSPPPAEVASEGVDIPPASTGDVPSGCRLFAIGDLHGDLSGARRALEAAKLIDEAGTWIGGCATLVQTGDIVDRGPEGVRTLYYFKALHKQARKSGGRVVQLIGNHEIIAFSGLTAYANQEEMRALGGLAKYQSIWRGKDGPIFKWLSTRGIIAHINETIFVHAGVPPSFASLGVSRLNLLARSQIQKADFGSGVFSDDGPVWTRKVIGDATLGDCTDLGISLGHLKAQRMVIGHTVQMNKKVVSYCQGRLLAIDIGMSRFMLSAAPGLIELLPNMDVQAYYSARPVAQASDEKFAIPGDEEYKPLLAIAPN